jgi:SDR family mycofactocin-dependent oxidoreductase
VRGPGIERSARRVALVSGAARGIGRASALALAREGCALVLMDRCADDDALSYRLATRVELDATVASCGSAALALEGDVRDLSSCVKAVELAVDRFGGLDVVVAGAGAIAGGTTIAQTSPAVLKAMIEINLVGVWQLIAAAVPALLARPRPRSGRIVAIASAGGLQGLPLLGAYVAAKHGVVGLVRSAAAELAPEQITVNAVAPGSTATTMLEESARIYGLSDPGEFARHHLEARLIDPVEVAAAVAFLAGQAASGITGAVLPVDLGMTSD